MTRADRFGPMTGNQYQQLRAEYIRLRDGANAARQAWSAFLDTSPLGSGDPSPQTQNIVRAYNDLIDAEKKEAAARDALFELLRPKD